jgi:hypothetical protein
MRHDVFTPPARLHNDDSILVVGVGSFGEQVGRILGVEWERVGIPANRVHILTIGMDTYGKQPAAAGAHLECLMLPPFDAVEYVTRREHDALSRALAQVPEADLRDLGGIHPHPAGGLLALHRYDAGIVARVVDLLGQLRAANEQGRLRCLVVAGMGDSLGAGMTVPLLERLREPLHHHRVRCELVLATPECIPDPTVGDRVTREHNGLATAAWWDAVLRGEAGIVCPGVTGRRDDVASPGPVQARTWIFSGGTQRVTYSESALASIVATCIGVHVLTPLGDQLEQERATYAEDILDGTWSGAGGGRHATSLVNVNACGLKLDCIPALYHLRAVEKFLVSVTASLDEETEKSVRSAADRFLEEMRLQSDMIVHDLAVVPVALGRDEILASGVPTEQLHRFIRSRLDDDLGRLRRLADGKQVPAGTAELIGRARDEMSRRCLQIAGHETGYLTAAIDFLVHVEKELGGRRAQAIERGLWARQELGDNPNEVRLETLVQRLERDTAGPGPDAEPGGRFATTFSVAVPTQVRKILEVAGEIREHAVHCGTAHVLAHVYEMLTQHADRLREELQATSYALSRAAAVCAREHEQVHRAARSALTYQRGPYATLLERAFARLDATLPQLQTSDLLRALGNDLQALAGDDDLLRRLLPLLRPDPERLASAVDEFLCSEPLVRDLLKESLAHAAPNVHIDHLLFAELGVVRGRWAVCTRRFYETYRDDVLDGMRLVESANPYNAFVVTNLDGFPFAALTYLQRLQTEENASGATWPGAMSTHAMRRRLDD